jgi:pSer/pThr/pTyr-binding forkhead associated (FHA) protein
MFYLYHINSLTYLELINGVSFGRNAGTKIFPEDVRMSGEHCKFHVNTKGVFVEDLGSKNRTVLDRVEILPHRKIPMQVGSMLELGSQRFIMTDKKLGLSDINAVIERHTKILATLEVVKMKAEMNERAELEISLMTENEQKLTAQLIEKKFRMNDAKKAIINLAKDTEHELRQLELKKVEILNSIVGKEEALHNEIVRLTNDVQTLQNQVERLKEDILLKKKRLNKE